MTHRRLSSLEITLDDKNPWGNVTSGFPGFLDPTHGLAKITG